MKPRTRILFALSVVIATLPAFTTTALAAEPGYTCDSGRGCKEVEGPVYDIGRGAKLTLPSGWKFYSYPTAPDPIMAGLREIRATKDGMVVAISPFPNLDKRVFEESKLCDMVAQGAAQYVKASKEQAVVPVPMSHGEVVGCYTSLSAANKGEKPFAVLPNRHHATVSSFVISAKSVVFSVSAVSESLPDDDYLALIKAIREID